MLLREFFNKDRQLDELNVAKTLDFIKQAHGDQLYGKLPYWRHPRAVALTGKRLFGNKFNSDAVKTAFLHDVVEDTHIGIDQLSKLGFSPQVIEAVGLLTKDKSLTYSQNIKRIIASGNPLAQMVKFADNYENYTGDKTSWDPARAASSQKKYLKSLTMLAQHLGVKVPVGESHHFAGASVGHKEGPAGQWRNKGPKKNKPAQVGDLVGGGAAEESVELDERRRRRRRAAAYGPGPYGWYGYYPGYSGDSGGEGGGDGGVEENIQITMKQSLYENIVSTDFMSALRDFLPIAMRVLKITKLPHIKLMKDVGDEEQPTFGRFKNNELIIDIGLNNRHPNDILRTLAHELVHFKQQLDNRLNPHSGDTGSPEENEAHAVAGVIMRHFNKIHPQYLRGQPLDLQETATAGATTAGNVSTGPFVKNKRARKQPVGANALDGNNLLAIGGVVKR